MALILKDRVFETCNSPGTGVVTLLGAVTGYQTFSATVGNANTCYYTIADQSGGNWEVGVGTYTASGNTLTRTTVISSSNGGSLTNFNSGVQNVFVTYPAEQAVYLDAGGALQPSTAFSAYLASPPAIGGTAANTGAFTTLSASSTVSGTGFSTYLASPPAIGGTTANAATFTNLTYTGTLTGSTGVLNIGSGQFYKDASGNVGIGTSSPSSKLQCVGTIASGGVGGTNGYFQLNRTDATNLGSIEWVTSGDEMRYSNRNGGFHSFYTSGAERMRLDSSGNLGIGTSSPNNKLVVSNSGAAGIEFGPVNGDIFTYNRSTSAYTDMILTANNISLRSNGGSSTLKLDSSGNLGLGVTPSGWSGSNPLMEFIGAGFIGAGDASTLNIGQNAYNNAGWKYKGTGAATLHSQYAGSFIWRTAPSGTAGNAISFTQAMTLDASGNLGLGVVPSGWVSRPAFEMSNSGAAYVMNNGTGAIVLGTNHYFNGSANVYKVNGYATEYATYSGQHVWLTAPSGTAGNAISFTQAMTLDASGNLTISGATATKASGTTWANPSDTRLKDNQQDYEKGLAELLQISVKTWEFNGKGGSSQGVKGIGVIADAIESILPDSVDTYKAKLNDSDEEETDIKRFDASEVIWLLVKSVQELSAELNELKAKVH